jgi:hypothetical protein
LEPNSEQATVEGECLQWVGEQTRFAGGELGVDERVDAQLMHID